MIEGFKTIIYPVKDIARAKALYATLFGKEPSVDAPYYAGFDLDGQHFGLDPHGHANGPVSYAHVSDIEKTLQTLVAAGAQVVQAAKGVGGGRLVAMVKDADGNVTGLIQG
jgi:predicted enzyme related to lactoylglutathione lyase